jgi:hypothetical protein
LVPTLDACTPPVRQYELKSQKLTCAQANDYAYRTLQSMKFTITAFEPAIVGHAGTLRGTRQDRGTQNVTVVVTCDGGNANVSASEDGKWLGQLEFKRGFFLAFTGTAAQTAVSESVASAEAKRPLEQKQRKGLYVRLEPVGGLGAKLDFDLDLAAAGVLPVLVSINNATPRTYALDPDDVTLAQADGTRVHPLAVAAAVQRVAVGAGQQAQTGTSASNSAEITQRLEGHLLTTRSVGPNQSVKGYLYFPLGAYVKGRVSLEDTESEEAEGFVVEF